MVCLFLIAATLARAGTLENVETALSQLRGKTPIRASYTVETSGTTDGRFGSDRTSSTISVDVTRSAEGVSVTIPATLLERAAEESRAHSGSFRNSMRNSIAHVSPLAVADGLNYAPAFSGIVRMGHLKEEHRESRNGQPARRLVLDIHQPMSKSEGIEIGEVKTIEDQMTLWIGNDDVPLAARRSHKMRGGFLFLHGDTEQTDDWTFSRNGDSLVLVRHEEDSKFSGVGQKGTGKSVATIVVR